MIWGPMGCRTGNYLLLNGDYESKDHSAYDQETLNLYGDFEGEVPGASTKDCGNYLDMNLPAMAKYLAGKFLDKFFMISSRTDLFIHCNILQYYSNHKQHTEKISIVFFRQKAEADRSLSLQLLLYYTFLSTFFQKPLLYLIEIYSKRTDTNFYIIRLFCTFIIRRI